MIDTGKVRARSVAIGAVAGDLLAMAEEVDRLRTAVGQLIAAGDRMWPWVVSPRDDVANLLDEWQALADRFDASRAQAEEAHDSPSGRDRRGA